MSIVQTMKVGNAHSQYDWSPKEFLNMRSSQVSGKIPTELGQLGKLETIILEGNWLSGTIPPELGNLFNAGKPKLQMFRGPLLVLF